MNTNKIPRLDSDQVEHVTSTLRAYKHRFRYAIVGNLLKFGPLSTAQLSEKLHLDELYVAEQLQILCEHALVSATWADDEWFYIANEPKIYRIQAAILNFAEDWH